MGFTSVIRHMSLRDWLSWIHSNRSDATLRLHSTESGSGVIWCSGGKIIDAEWEGRIAEEAVRQVLALSSGAVTIDFSPVQRAARIVTPTLQLLHVSDAAAVRASGAKVEAALVAPEGAPGDRFSQLALMLAGSIRPVASASSPPPQPASRRLRRGEVILGAVAVAALAVAGFAFGRLRAASEPARTAAREPAPLQTRAEPMPAAASPAAPVVTPRPRQLPAIPFVSIEVEPAHAEIWIDRELAGRGSLQIGAIHDGMMHELRFVAPGYESKSLFFRDSPPPGRVLLQPSETSAGTSAATAAVMPSAPQREAPSVTDDADPEERGRGDDPPKKVVRRRPAPVNPAPAPARARSVTEDPPASPSKPAERRPPQVELIEVQTPRVQVLD